MIFRERSNMKEIEKNEFEMKHRPCLRGDARRPSMFLEPPCPRYDRDSLPALLGHCGRLIDMLDARNRGRGRVLGLLAERGVMMQTELLDELRVRPGSLSELLRRMEEQGLITRSPDENDRRRSVISITEEGKKSAVEGVPAPDLFSALSAEEQETLKNLLKKLSDSFVIFLPRLPADHERRKRRDSDDREEEE